VCSVHVHHVCVHRHSTMCVFVYWCSVQSLPVCRYVVYMSCTRYIVYTYSVYMQVHRSCVVGTCQQGYSRAARCIRYGVIHCMYVRTYIRVYIRMYLCVCAVRLDCDTSCLRWKRAAKGVATLKPSRIAEARWRANRLAMCYNV
jgi:hypothetical protein